MKYLSKSASIAFTFVISVNSAMAAVYNAPVNLSNTPNNEGNFLLSSNGDVTWTGYNGLDWDLWRYQASTKTKIQLTATSSTNETPSIINNATNSLVYFRRTMTSPQVVDLMFLKYGATTPSKLNINSMCGAAAVSRISSNDDVLWTEFDPAYPNVCNVYMKNAVSGTTTDISKSVAGVKGFDFYKGRDVVWVENTTPPKVKKYVASTGTVVDLTSQYGVGNGMCNSDAWVSWNANGDIVWTGGCSPDEYVGQYIFTTNLSSVVAGTQGDGLRDMYPLISPTGSIAWEKNNSSINNVYFKTATGNPVQVGLQVGYNRKGFMASGDVIYVGKDPVGLDSEIYIYKVASNTRVNVSNNSFEEMWWWMNKNGDIAWQSGGFGTALPTGGDIFVYLASTGTTERLTNDTYQDEYPVLNDNAGQIAWAKNMGTAYEIYYATRGTADVTPPTAPTNLTAVRQMMGGVKLTWTASTDNVGVKGYAVERCEGVNCVNFAPLPNNTTTTTTFTDGSTQMMRTYRYRVRAYDAANNYSGYSNIVSISMM